MIIRLFIIELPSAKADCGDVDKAQKTLSPVYARFIDGFDTLGLKKEKGLLDGMS